MSKELITGARRGNMFFIEPEKVHIVGLDDKAGEEDILWDSRISLPVDEGLVLSIMAIGVQQIVSVVVREGVPCVSDGRQRVRAAREANVRLKKHGEPPVLIRVAGENASKVNPERLQTTMVALNELRRADDVLTKAAKADRMRARGVPEDAIAVAFGVSKKCIDSWAKIGALAPAVRKAIGDGRIAATAAAKLAHLPEAEQVAALEGLTEAGVKPTKAKVEERTQKNADGEQKTKPSGVVVRKLVEAEGIELPEGFLQALRWMRGELSATRIKGLSAALAKVQKPTKAASEAP